jgi:hypothetical protein
MTDRDTETAPGADIRRLAAHAAECDACHRAPLPFDRLAAVLNTSALDVDTRALSAHTLARLRPVLDRQAAAAWWRRMLFGLLLSLLPLPLVVAYDAYFLSAAYGLVVRVLPATVAAYLVLSYAALLVFLFALTYAAIPLLVMRGGRKLSTINHQLSTAS